MRVLLFTMVSVVQGLTASLAPVQRHSSAVDGMHLRLVVPVACHLVHATLLELLGRDAHLPVRARAVVAQRNLQDDNHGNALTRLPKINHDKYSVALRRFLSL